MSERNESPVYVLKGDDGSYTLFVERPKPPQQRGCFGPFFVLLAVILFLVVAPNVASPAASPSGGTVQAADTPLVGYAALQSAEPAPAPAAPPLVAVAELTPEGQLRDLIYRLGVARNAALGKRDLMLLDGVAADPLLTFEREYAMRMWDGGISELGQLLYLELHAFQIAGPAPFVCASETWNMLTTGADGLTSPAYQQTMHLRYTLERRGEQLLLATMTYLDQPCG